MGVKQTIFDFAIRNFLTSPAAAIRKPTGTLHLDETVLDGKT